MKIDNRLQSLLPVQGVAQKKPVTNVQKSARVTGDAFSLELSAAVEQMKAPSKEEEIRMDRVEAIRSQLAAGTYNISGKDVANKILKALK